VSALSFILILASLVAFVAGQLLLKRGMEMTNGARHPHYVLSLVAGTSAMTISFFLTLGLLQRFDLSYLYPFQGLSVVFIAVAAALILREKLTLQLVLGALLISAGICLVSLS
jgi:drug/metabolite transporter (DMT)-like permease